MRVPVGSGSAYLVRTSQRGRRVEQILRVVMVLLPLRRRISAAGPEKAETCRSVLRLQSMSLLTSVSPHGDVLQNCMPCIALEIRSV